jgi:hypothetical protein
LPAWAVSFDGLQFGVSPASNERSLDCARDDRGFLERFFCDKPSNTLRGQGGTGILDHHDLDLLTAHTPAKWIGMDEVLAATRLYSSAHSGRARHDPRSAGGCVSSGNSRIDKNGK